MFRGICVTAAAFWLFCACVSNSAVNSGSSPEQTVGASETALCLGLGDLVVVGTAIDEKSRSPLGGISVHVHGTELRAITDDAGNYRIPRLGRSLYFVEAAKAGYYSEQRQVGRMDADVLGPCNAEPKDTVRLDFYMRVNPDLPPR